MPQKGGAQDDFFMIEANGLACQKLVCDLVSTRLPKAYGFDRSGIFRCFVRPRSARPAAWS